MAPQEPLRVALVSLGCPKSLIDSERMLALLAEAGCTVAAPTEAADVIVVNTCGFLAEARDESLDVVREAVQCKRCGRASRVVLAGCLASRDGEALYDAVPGIDAIVGVEDRDDVVSAVRGSGRVTRLSSCNGTIHSDAGRFRLTPPHTAYLRIAEGCSRQCSFCTIPAIRGPFRSKPLDQVLAEAEELVSDGAVELNVIAQDTTAYGADLPEQTDLARLLGRLDRVEGVRWIRLLYAYPLRFTDALIDRIATAEHVVPYVDVPIQHVSDRILKAMRRGVSRKDIEVLLEKLRRRIGGLVLRTTLIVGFPGEGDEEFRELLEFVRDFGFDALGVFEFSPEEGTAAAEMPGQLSSEAKAERREALMLVQQERAFAANRARVGESLAVLVDGTDVRARCVARHCGQAPEIDGSCLLTAPRAAGTFAAGSVVDWDGYDLIVQPD
jgi:ribosomal protein S12 methylthiotransferase